MRHPSFSHCGWPPLVYQLSLEMQWCYGCSKTSLGAISNRVLASLCVTDLIVGLVTHPVWIAVRCWIQPPRTYKFLDLLRQVINLIHSTAATLFNVCCVSVDRFHVIRFPFRYENKNVDCDERCS